MAEETNRVFLGGSVVPFGGVATEIEGECLPCKNESALLLWGQVGDSDVPVVANASWVGVTGEGESAHDVDFAGVRMDGGTACPAV